MNGKIMIQANSLDKLTDMLLFILEAPTCKKENVAEFIGFSLRQVAYYANALRYLGLLDKAMRPTPLAYGIFTNHKGELRERVYTCILSDPIISRIFARCYLLPESDIHAYAKKLLIEEYPGYSMAVYDRRADNLVKWCQRIMLYHDNFILPSFQTTNP